MSTEKSVVIVLAFVIANDDSEPVYRKHRFQLKENCFKTIKEFDHMCHSFYKNDISDVFYTIDSALKKHENISLCVDSDIEALMHSPELFECGASFVIGLNGRTFINVSQW